MLRAVRKRATMFHWIMELFVVFAGVLIALAAQGWAEDRSARARAEAAESRIREELQGNIGLGLERIALHGCVKDRLTTLADGLGKGRSQWNSARIAVPSEEEGWLAFDRFYRVPSRTWMTSAYDGSLASGALDALPATRAAQLSYAYSAMKKINALNEEEQRLAARLAVLGFDRRLSEEQRQQLLSVVTQQDHLNALIFIVSKQRVEGYLQLYPLTPKERAELEDYAPVAIDEWRKKYGSCVDPGALKTLDPTLQI